MPPLEKPALDQNKPPEKIESQSPTDQSQQKPSDQPKPTDKSGSIYQELGVEDAGKEGTATFPANWREQLATGEDGKVDQEELKRLQRFASPKELNKSYKAAAQRLRSGEYKRGKPENATPEQLAAWRAENGIPENFEGYDLPLPEGVKFDQLDEVTKENINGIRKVFHDAELQGPQAAKVTKAIIELAEKDLEATAQKDAVAQETTEDTLRADWGPDYRNNLKIAEAHGLKTFGDDFYAICKARLPDGRRLGDLPGFHKYLADQGRLDGSDEHIDSESPTKGGTLEGRRQEIKKIMETDFARYQREGLAEEYQGILEKLEGKGKLK